MSESKLPGTPVPETGRYADRVRSMLETSDCPWPMGWTLPMKRRYIPEGESSPTVEAGFCVTIDFKLIVLRGFPSAAGFMAQLNAEDNGVENPWYTEHVVKRYTSVDELLADGWTVD